MKNLLVILIALTASSAFATKARNTALGNALHLKGTETVYGSPYHLMELNNFVAFETGKTAATSANDGAEGSILMSTGDNSKLLLSLGHQDETVLTQRAAINGSKGANTYAIQQNPVEAIYAWKDGDNVWGLGTYYSNFNNKTTGQKESSAGVRLAASYGAFKWKANIGLINSAVNAVGDQLNNDMYFNLGLRYGKDTMRYGLDFTTWNASETLAAAGANYNHNRQVINFRMVNVHKADAGEVFYGVGLVQDIDKEKNADTKTTKLKLPVIMGAEFKATDWMQLRGSITQDVIISQEKNDAQAQPLPAPQPNDIPAAANTTVANAGVGLTWGKAQLDATLGGLVGGAATQDINLGAGKFLAQVGFVYNY